MEKKKSLRDHQQIASVSLNRFCLLSKNPPQPPVLNNRKYQTGWNNMKLYIIQAGITNKKISFYMHNSDCGGLMVKNAKIF